MKRAGKRLCITPTILPLLPAYEYQGKSPEDFPVAYKAQYQILSLPMFFELENKQLNEVAESIRAFLKNIS